MDGWSQRTKFIFVNPSTQIWGIVSNLWLSIPWGYTCDEAGLSWDVSKFKTFTFPMYRLRTECERVLGQPQALVSLEDIEKYPLLRSTSQLKTLRSRQLSIILRKWDIVGGWKVQIANAVYVQFLCLRTMSFFLLHPNMQQQPASHVPTNFF